MHALYIVDTKRYGEPALSSMEALIGSFEDQGREHLTALVEAGNRKGVVVKPHCSHGDLAEKIVETADEFDVDVVVPCLEGVTSEKLCRHGLDTQLIEPLSKIIDNGARLPA